MGTSRKSSKQNILFILNTKKKTTRLEIALGYIHQLSLQIDDITYADDIELFANTIKKMKELIDIWTEKIE